METPSRDRRPRAGFGPQRGDTAAARQGWFRMTDERHHDTAPVPPLRPVVDPGAVGAVGARIAPPPDPATRPAEVSLWPAVWLVVLVFLLLATLFAVLF